MKNRILKYFTDEYKDEALNLYEKYTLSKEKNITVFGRSFYTPNVWKWFEENLQSNYFKVESNGLFQEAERRMVSFNNSDESPFPMKLLKIENTSKFTSLTHRDYLGGILSLGIERNKIGDLLVSENACYLPVHEEVEEFIIFNLERIAKVKCNVKIIDNLDFIPKFSFKEELVLVSSLRADGIVSKITNTSRTKAQGMIEQGQVLLNYAKIKDKSQELKSEDRITIRGFGKIILGDCVGNSKSGKVKLIIKKYT
jgi:RNA-binding protein YlmH